MTAINQKEYLKKYLGIGRAPGEKKKKKKKPIGDRLKIIDDNADVLISQEIQEDISAANEDAPQIVAVIDERPPSLRIDEQTKSNLWTPIGGVSTSTEIKPFKLNASFKLQKQTKSVLNSSKSKIKSENKTDHTRIDVKREVESSPTRSVDNDRSPPRIRRPRDYSPPRRSIKVEDSPRTRSSGDDNTPPRRRRDDADNSPPRKRNRGNDNSPPRRKRGEDSSSSRRNYDSDYSPPKRNRDQSPPRRKNREDSSPPRRQKREKDNSPPRSRAITPPSRRDVDSSPPRRKNTDLSRPRKAEKKKDFSPPRKKNSSPRLRGADDISPPRRRNRDDTPPKRKNKDGDGAPPRNRNKERSSRWGDWSPETSSQTSEHSDKMKKTLDGKKAGLQSSKDMVKETALLKRKEDEIFQSMSAEVSGRNAATVVRAKETRDPEEEARRLEKERKTKEKYDRWGKGMKQVDEQNERIAEQLHEMSKPLARYADNEDLEKYLKEQERDGDPMLAYIRKKKKKQAVDAGVPEKPMYMGEFMPNRFGIRPGYRWDGVDRSNGYEKRWFEVQNAKKATQEEALKWSTEDM